MTKTKLTLDEIYILDNELTGKIDPQTREKLTKGILNHKMNLKIKFWLNELKAKTADTVKGVEELKAEMVRKYGVEDENKNVSIVPKLEDGSINPKYEEFMKEFVELLEEEKELEHKEFTPDDLDIDTEENYPILFKLVKKSE